MGRAGIPQAVPVEEARDQVERVLAREIEHLALWTALLALAAAGLAWLWNPLHLPAGLALLSSTYTLHRLHASLPRYRRHFAWSGRYLSPGLAGLALGLLLLKGALGLLSGG